MNVIKWSTWLLGIVFPVVLIACAGKLVVVRTEIRLRDTREAKARFNAWLGKSKKMLRRRDAALTTFERAARARSLRSPIGLWHGIVAGLSAILVIWIRLRGLLGGYLAGDCHDRINRNIAYLSHREGEYRTGLAKDLASLKETLATGVDWKRFFGKNGRQVFFGVLAMLVSTIIASAFEWWSGPASWLGVSIAVVIVTVLVVIVVVSLPNSKAISYSWGCVFVLLIGLTTIEFSPLEGTWFEENIDAQRVTTMFIGVGIVLTLSQLFDQRGMGPDVGPYERYVVRQSYRPAKSGVRGSWFTRGMHERAIGGEERLYEERMEKFWVFVVLALYGFSAGHFLVSILQDASWNGNEAADESIRPILPIMTATFCTLALPLISLARATRAKAFAFVVGVVTVVLVAVAVCGSVEAGSNDEDETPLEEVDLPIDASLGLSEDDRRILERGVYFEFGSSELTSNAKEVLCLVLWVLSEHDGLELMIEGHTDSIGSEWFNQNLGRERASIVQEFFVANRLDSARIVTKSSGEDEPHSLAQNREGRARNRRVEFEIDTTRVRPQEGTAQRGAWFQMTPCHTGWSGDAVESQ